MGLAKNNQLESEASPKSSAHPPLKSSFDVIAGRRDVYRAKLVFYLFLVSLGVFFLAAMIAYCVIRLQSFRPVDQQAFQYLTLNLPTSFWISTLMLVLVSGFLQRAVWHIRRENQLQFRRFLILGWTSAIAFLAIQYSGMNQLFDSHFKNASLTTAQTIKVTVTPEKSDKLVFQTPCYVNVPENDKMVIEVLATDPNSTDQSVIYSISGGSDGDAFAIDPTNGQLRFNSPPDFELPQDSDLDNVYEVEVLASENNGSSATQMIQVAITPTRGKAPEFRNPNQVNVAGNTTGVMEVYAANTELAHHRVTYSISGGSDGPLFSIDTNTGNLKFVDRPDFEMPADSNQDNVYEVEVTATRFDHSSKVYGLCFTFAFVHALHVLGGIGFLGFVIWQSLRHRYDHERHFAVEHCASYWHFLDVVWVLMLLTFFLMG